MLSVGDGSTIRGWKDIWIPEVGPLFTYISGHDRLNLDSTLKDWVLTDGSWNLGMLRIWLSEDIIRRVVSIPPLHLAVLFHPVEPTEPHISEKPVRPSLNKHEPQQTRENQAITDWKSCIISKKESRTMVEEKAKPWEMARKGGGMRKMGGSGRKEKLKKEDSQRSFHTIGSLRSRK
ncbi:hypothetical protein J1N35_026570 [Gossypium stocksii]|uniref:DUF4283 domain-containing protein n=1 Tax=Gossypium stocksii TaxID=47602 RepID=A0A9D3V8J9_9ROSI|nr:hypothetical protein J1N35_026570 [Gossypium stocksii]